MSERSDISIRAPKLCRFFLNVIEVYIPAIMLMCLFIAFIVGIVFRYIFRDPQSWTYELSSISFLQFAILSSCFVQREDEHIVFDMIYARRSKRTQCIMRIIGGIIVCFTATALIPTSIQYVGTMLGLKTQIMKLPRWCVFTCFPITFIIMDIRALIRLVLDIKAFVNKSYDKTYPKAKEAKKA